MTRQDVLHELEELMELEAGTLTGAETLADLEGWDSMVVLGFIGLADDQFGVTLEAQDVMDAATIDDLIGLLGSAVEV